MYKGFFVRKLPALLAVGFIVKGLASVEKTAGAYSKNADSLV